MTHQNVATSAGSMCDCDWLPDFSLQLLQAGYELVALCTVNQQDSIRSKPSFTTFSVSKFGHIGVLIAAVLYLVSQSGCRVTDRFK